MNFWNSPTMPCGASATNPTSNTPTIRRFSSDEMLTLVHSCTEPSSSAPMTGPVQVEVPPIIGMAMAFTATIRLNAETGSTKVTK